MAKHRISLKPGDFKKLHAKLKKLEVADPSLKIGNTLPSNFLIANAVADDQTDTPEIRTKRIILHIAGNFTTKPETMGDEIDLTINLLYRSDEYTLLQMRLDALVKEFKASASISSSEATGCSTVGDCTALVDEKIK
ncbi:MAG: hypothetical protein IPP96_16265 [Chitinophagaceae bacterium]|nr:hypothetical protein [Chitinophagaceae bacterium]